jgi:cation diffusion facilitator CzcD-associated flavoprotein CzcO
VRTRVAVVGSGFGGLGAAIRLKQEGEDDFLILEKAQDVGGTWRDNSYPGCACDVESHLYSLSFAPHAGWRHRYSRQPEIWEYLRGCVDRFGLRPHLRFGCEVRAAVWDAAASEWCLETSQGPVRAAVFVMATGPLSTPVVPDLPGLSRFQGRVFHSAEWDHEYGLEDRVVAVIGTGASAIQFVPEVQRRAARLFLFQRTPAWVLPRPDGPIPAWRRGLYRRVPTVQRALRLWIYLYRELSLLLFRHPRAMRLAQRIARRHMERAVADPGLRARLTPSYTMGCKRILISDDYYPALARPNVEVVSEPIVEIHERAIVTGDGVARAVDAIILATGFRPTDPPLAACIRGRDGRTLKEVWAGSPRALLGTSVAGFPNFFMLLGPNTGLGHSSVVYMTEGQIEHLLGALRHMKERGLAALEPRPEAQAAYAAALDQRMRGTVWTAGGCASWYLDASGRNSTLWPDFSWRFRRRARRFRAHEYLPTGGPP